MAQKSALTDKVILVVDDEPDVLETVEEELDMCLIHKATDYDTALQYLLSYTYDIVILDIMGVNGFELLKTAVSREFPTVMLTAHALSPDSLKKSIKLGAVSFLPKEKIAELSTFLEDVVLGEGKPVWEKLFSRLGHYFGKRFGPDWKEKDRFFKEFEENLKKDMGDQLPTTSFFRNPSSPDMAERGLCKIDMGFISGFQEYLDQNYATSVFDEACESKQPWEFHLHGHHIIRAEIFKNLIYDLKIKSHDTEESVLSKTDVKILYPLDISEKIRPLIKTDPKVSRLSLEPILAPGLRHHIKNKSLFPLMKERQVVFFTLLEGEIIKGLITGFSRYEIKCSLKGGLPVSILRHAVYDLRNKKGRSFLKSSQGARRDWKKSSLYMP